jgi:putative LysE/RhtB family amino acid efflux pump
MGLFLSGVLVGVIIGAPLGPIGSITLLELTSGNLRRAVASMSGCVTAELVLLVFAVFSVGRLSSFMTSLPKFVPIAVGMAMLAIGFYYLTATQMPKIGSVATFVLAFKITLLAPNNLAGLVALIAAMGIAAKLNSFTPDAVFMAGEMLGVLLGWMGLFWVGWRLRHDPRAQRFIPWLRKGVGAIMIVVGSILVVQQVFAA